MTPLRRVSIAASLLVSVIVIGVIGYIILEGWTLPDALYMTVITITTVGYGEVRPLSESGRFFSIFLIIFGVGGVLYTLTSAVEYVMEVQLGSIIEERRMKNRIAKLSNHFILCGYGRVGGEIARHFQQEGSPFVVIDQSSETKAKAEGEGCLVILGDAADDNILSQAGLERARGLVAATGSDTDNTYITLSARGARPDLFIVSRANTAQGEVKLKQAGANRVISPHSIGGRRMAMLALRPLVVDFIDTVTHARNLELLLADITISEGSPLAGLTIEEGSRIRTGATILALKKGDDTLLMNPPKESRIEPGDQLVIIGTREQLRTMEGSARKPG